MAGVMVTKCPHCQAVLKIPDGMGGKRVKCKKCEQTFVVPTGAVPAPHSAAHSSASKGAVPGSPPAASKAASSGKGPPPRPATGTPESSAATASKAETSSAPKKPFLDDDEGVAQVGVIMEEDVPRCPHCAMELVPPDAIVCIHCGFNNRTRVKADTKKVYAPTPGEWFMHLAPGVLALLMCIGLIVLNVITTINMRGWLEGTFLEMDEVDAAGRKRFYIAPGFFIFLIAFISLGIFVPCLRFGIRRLFIEYRPPEQLKLR